MILASSGNFLTWLQASKYRKSHGRVSSSLVSIKRSSVYRCCTWTMFNHSTLQRGWESSAKLCRKKVKKTCYQVQNPIAKETLNSGDWISSLLNFRTCLWTLGSKNKQTSITQSLEGFIAASSVQQRTKVWSVVLKIQTQLRLAMWSLYVLLFFGSGEVILAWLLATACTITHVTLRNLTSYLTQTILHPIVDDSL